VKERDRGKKRRVKDIEGGKAVLVVPVVAVKVVEVVVIVKVKVVGHIHGDLLYKNHQYKRIINYEYLN